MAYTGLILVSNRDRVKGLKVKGLKVKGLKVKGLKVKGLKSKTRISYFCRFSWICIKRRYLTYLKKSVNKFIENTKFIKMVKKKIINNR